MKLMPKYNEKTNGR